VATKTLSKSAAFSRSINHEGLEPRGRPGKLGLAAILVCQGSPNRQVPSCRAVKSMTGHWEAIRVRTYPIRAGLVVTLALNRLTVPLTRASDEGRAKMPPQVRIIHHPP
jgi:hypothetical protein